MRQILLFLSLFLLLNLPVNAQPILSENAKISIFTCSPGEELYSLFGHTAIRVIDDSLNLDLVFNYGIFSYSTSNFAYKFAKGETYYRMGIQRFRNFIDEYISDKRPVYEHILNLNRQEKQEMFNFLHINNLPENRVYLYSFFLDNCATRPRDVVEKILGDKLSWHQPDNSYIKPMEKHWKYKEISQLHNNWDGATFRTIIDIYMPKNSWNKYGICFALGMPTDTTADKYHAMFAPDFFMNALENAVIKRETGYEPLIKTKPIYYKPIKLYENIDPQPYILPPFQTFLILFVIVLMVSIYEIKRKKHFIAIDVFLYFITGIMGCIILFMSFFSMHDFVQQNYDILWANPFNLLFALLLPFKKIRHYTLTYQYVIFFISLITALLWPFLPETLVNANLLIVGTILVRSIVGINVLRRNETA
ncbi:MAG: DUF4105 domain-containing protein [Bacteroidales bacterium]|nr:DUF4105 domain-containing protein [Bacteroidales bacterium]